jgi:hypothetical protein
MHVRSLEVSTHNYIRNSIRAYFEGQPGCHLRWIMGVIDGAKEQARTMVETRFGQYAGSQAYRDLMAELWVVNRAEPTFLLRFAPESFRHSISLARWLFELHLVVVLRSNPHPAHSCIPQQLVVLPIPFASHRE